MRSMGRRSREIMPRRTTMKTTMLVKIGRWTEAWDNLIAVSLGLPVRSATGTVLRGPSWRAG